MAAEQDVGSMVVRLVGDTSQYTRAMEEAQKITGKTADYVQATSSKIEGIIETLKTFATQALAVFTGMSAFDWLKKSTAAFEEREAVEKNLQSTMGGTLFITEEVRNSYAEYAKGIQDVTVFSEKATLTLLAQAEALGLSSDKAQEAVTQSIALAQAKGGEAKEYLNLTAALAKGETAGIESLLGMSSTGSSTDRVAAVKEELDKLFQNAIDKTKTVDGQIAQSKNNTTSFLESIGEIASKITRTVSDAWSSLWNGLAKAVTLIKVWVGKAFDDIREAVSTALGGGDNSSWIPTWEQFKTTVSNAYSIVTLVVKNFGSILDAIMQSAVKGWDYLADAAKSAAVAVAEAFQSDTGSGFLRTIALIPATLAVIGIAIANLGTILSGAMDLAISAWGSIGPAVAKATDSVIGFFTTSKEGVDEATESIGTKFLGSFTTTITTILAVVVAVKVLTVAYGVLSSVMAFLKVNQLLSAAAWLIWTAATLVANGVMIVFTTTLTVSKFIFGLFTASAVAAGAGITTATAANTLFGISLAAVNAEMIVFTVIAAVITTGVLIVGFTLLAGVVWGIYTAAIAVIDVLSTLPTTSGPIGHITGLFQEWNGILLDVVRAMKVDMNIAWELMAAGFRLAVEQVKDLWGPLWEFIKKGFFVLWQVVGDALELGFYQAIANVSGKLLQMLDVFGIATDKVQEMLDQVNKDTLDGLKATIRSGSLDLEKMVNDFSVTEGKGTKDARKGVEEVRLKLKKEEDKQILEEWFDYLRKEIGDEAEKAGEEVNKEFAKGVHGLDAAEFGSGEAIKRIQAYKDNLMGVGKEQEKFDPSGMAKEFKKQFEEQLSVGKNTLAIDIKTKLNLNELRQQIADAKDIVNLNQASIDFQDPEGMEEARERIRGLSEQVAELEEKIATVFGKKSKEEIDALGDDIDDLGDDLEEVGEKATAAGDAIRNLGAGGVGGVGLLGPSSGPSTPVSPETAAWAETTANRLSQMWRNFRGEGIEAINAIEVQFSRIPDEFPTPWNDPTGTGEGVGTGPVSEETQRWLETTAGQITSLWRNFTGEGQEAIQTVQTEFSRMPAEFPTPWDDWKEEGLSAVDEVNTAMQSNGSTPSWAENVMTSIGDYVRSIDLSTTGAQEYQAVQREMNTQAPSWADRLYESIGDYVRSINLPATDTQEYQAVQQAVASGTMEAQVEYEVTPATTEDQMISLLESINSHLATIAGKEEINLSSGGISAFE
jgi:hypothetical protein